MSNDEYAPIRTVLTIDDLRNIPPRVPVSVRIADASKAPEVVLRGEPLTDPILWVGRQWAVTGYGVEARDGTYVIPIERLWEASQGWTWEHQLAEKGWADVPDFAAAMALARQHYADRKPNVRAKKRAKVEFKGS